MTSRTTRFLLAMSLLMALGACRPAAAAPEADNPPLHATPTKPNGTGITVRYRLDGVPQAGKRLRLTLEFSGIAADGATAWFTLDTGLAWDGAPPAELALAAGPPARVQLAVVPQGDGLAYLNVFTRQGGAESSTAIAVQAGQAKPALRRPGAMKSGPGGDKVISIPVP